MVDDDRGGAHGDRGGRGVLDHRLGADGARMAATRISSWVRFTQASAPSLRALLHCDQSKMEGRGEGRRSTIIIVYFTDNMNLNVISPADFHVHLRQKPFNVLIVPHVRKGGFSLAYVMVNNKTTAAFC